MRLARAALIALSLLAVSSAAIAQNAAPALTTIRFTAAPSDDLLPFWYAQSTGMFKAAGLDVQVSSVSTGAIVTQAVIGGAADIGRTSPDRKSVV